MSDSESTLAAAPPHPHLGGKSLQSLERPRYKSWRKKYRKMRHHFDTTLEENKRLFKEEQKLDHIAKRLREELDGLLELCLDLNGTPALPPDLRFNLNYPLHPSTIPEIVEDDIAPEKAAGVIESYVAGVQTRTVEYVDLHAVRVQMLEKLAAQDVETLAMLENAVSRPTESADDLAAIGLADGEDAVPMPVSYLTQEQEDEYLERLDEKIAAAEGAPPTLQSQAAQREKDLDAPLRDNRNMADLTPRELLRLMELNNPQSEHNWLKTHTKVLTNLGGDDDGDSVADGPSKASGSKRRTGKDQKTLAKQVGDRAVERAREGWSPGAGSAAGVGEDEEMVLEEGGGRKRAKDADGTYRLKGSRPSAGGGGKAKRKRSGEDLGVGGGKKARVEGE